MFLLHHVRLDLWPSDEPEGRITTTAGTYYLDHNAFNHFRAICGQIEMLTAQEKAMWTETDKPFVRKGWMYLPNQVAGLTSFPSNNYKFFLYIDSTPPNDRERIIIRDAEIFS